MLGCLDIAQMRIIRGSSIVWSSLPGVSDAITTQWNRIADDISLGSFTVSLADDSCCPPPIHAKADKVEYIRNGTVEWAGQVTRFSEDGDAVTIEAQDLLGMYQRRLVHSTINITAELTAQIDEIHVDADDIDPIPITWTPFPTGIVSDLDVLATDYRIAWEVIREIAGNGLDITAVGTRVFYGDLTQIPLRDLVLTDQMIRGFPSTGEAGEGTATRVIVKNGGGLAGVYPPGVPTIDPRYGIEEVVLEATDVTSIATLNQYAQAEWEQRNRVPRFVAFNEGAWLDEEFPYTLAELIPGRVIRVEIRGECSTTSQQMRISQITYRVDAGNEQIRIEAAPIGTVFERENQ